MSHSIRDDIALSTINLLIGDNARIICPYCKGTNKDMWVGRIDTGIMYYCHRASTCGKRGFIPDITNTQSKPTSKTFKPKYYNKPLGRLNAEQRRVIHQKWYITPMMQDSMGFKWSYEDKRLYIPMYYEHELVGCVTRDLYHKYGLGGGITRSLHHKQNIKSISYWEVDNVPKLYVPGGMEQPGGREQYWEHQVCYIVEDPLSAIRVSKYADCVAILGCNLTDTQVNYLKTRYKYVILALDADTWTVSGTFSLNLGERLRNKYALLFDNFELLYIPKDFKDMSDIELTRYLNIN